ncbi:cellulose-binding domain-containing protein [Umezawaea endophytica]|uniref:Cellulose-binding domain-containing protein n=1 Tax=Umezawaea endophytica TaxID=1654476 RepID=A0A9X2VJ88_9PSEU|nr:cellulose-binding domain-containing protein [Umezawaea endophytica]MCS7477603.1 cellulose-binding domain-containing protein [Umezawaea endophytica]
MTTPASPHKRSTRTALFAAAALATVAVVVAAILVSTTSGAESTPSQMGNATHFAGFGSSYSGCGLPQDVLDSQNFVSLNVFDTPGDYSTHARPLPTSESHRIGRWENGRNCGRYVQVTLGSYCTGINDGTQGQPFCRGGSWIGDDFNGATLTMVVADGCADATAWCRDDPDHLRLSTSSLTRFTKNGVSVAPILPDHWNNRHVSWSYVPTPNYSGDLELGFLRDSQASRPVLAVSHLPNGIHGVEYLDPNGTWRQAKPNGDMGQAFVLGPASAGGTDYRIRVRDVSDELVNRGRVYRFGLPADCSSRCADSYTKVHYSTEEGPTVTSTDAWTTAPRATTTEVTTTTTTVEAAPTTTTTSDVAAPPAPTTTTTTTQAPTPGCTATYSVGGSWQGAHQVEVTVRNTGPRRISGWRVTFSVAGSQRFTNTWNADVSQSGKRVSATNEDYNGSLASGASTTWGSIVSGVDQPVTGLSCSPR